MAKYEAGTCPRCGEKMKKMDGYDKCPKCNYRQPK